ncbi:MAG: pyruvate kinase [Desulfomonilaceae bacterium]|nr:pyruvate kinase [Desulfomonilaceae bacterium]
MELPFKKTKIVCTIGPASQSVQVLETMMRNGMDVARVNFSHGDLAGHKQVIDNIRTAAGNVGKRIAILGDLPGPKIRIGELAEETVNLPQGETFVLHGGEDIVGDAHAASVSLHCLAESVKPGDKIFLNDGLIQLKVIRSVDCRVHCQVIAGGELRSHKGVNIPGIELGISAITEYDRKCAKFALEQGVDALGVSFVQSAQDISTLREYARSLGYDPFVIAKIERSRALEDIDSIIFASDGIMVARGDLGVEIPIERIAVTQKRIIHTANVYGKPVITATQMLESMVDVPRPTRAEATDVANAILDGTDCVMLSEESAIGSYPVQAVQMLARIAEATEGHIRSQTVVETIEASVASRSKRVEELISLSVYHTVRRLVPVAVITPTESGSTARRVARFRLPVWVVAISPSESTCQALQFSYGVYPILEPEPPAGWSTYVREKAATLPIRKGPVVLTEGYTVRHSGGTNRMEIIDLT